MKCVQIVVLPSRPVESRAAGDIVRVSDDEAKRLVAKGQAKYTNKKAWKDAGRKR